jgi:hypothetical protein
MAKQGQARQPSSIKELMDLDLNKKSVVHQGTFAEPGEFLASLEGSGLDQLSSPTSVSDIIRLGQKIDPEKKSIVHQGTFS